MVFGGLRYGQGVNFDSIYCVRCSNMPIANSLASKVLVVVRSSAGIVGCPIAIRYHRFSIRWSLMLVVISLVGAVGFPLVGRCSFFRPVVGCNVLVIVREVEYFPNDDDLGCSSTESPRTDVGYWGMEGGV